jgi:hypothetical protein
MSVCRHPLMRHTVWYWVHDPNDPIPAPYEAHFDNRKDALAAVSELVAEAPVELRWVKAFRAHNEVYECYRWVNPNPLPDTGTGRDRESSPRNIAGGLPPEKKLTTGGSLEGRFDVA